MVSESVLEGSDDHIVLSPCKNIDSVPVKVFRAVLGWRRCKDTDHRYLSIDRKVLPCLLNDVAGFVFHGDTDDHITGIGVGKDAEVVGIQRSDIRVVDVVVQHGERLVLAGQNSTVRSGDVDGWRGAEVFVDLDSDAVLARNQRGAFVARTIAVNHREFSTRQARCPLQP